MTIRFKKGFSIIGVLVAAGLMGFLALLFSDMMKNSNKAQRNVQNAVDWDLLKNSVNLLITSKACDNAFTDVAGNPINLNWSATMAEGENIVSAASPVPVHSIKHGNSVLVEQGASLGGGMVVSSVGFVDAVYGGLQSVDVAGVPTTFRAFTATLQIAAQKASDSYGARAYSQNFVVRLLASNGATSGSVQRCHSTSPAFGWVAMPALGAANGGVAPSDWIQYPAGVDRSPRKICQDAGYLDYAGPCRTSGAGLLTNGSVIAHNTSGYWSVGCAYGTNLSKFQVGSNSEIMCVK